MSARGAGSGDADVAGNLGGNGHGPVDGNVRLSVAPEQLVDVVMVPPPSWAPQTIGWPILAGVLAVVGLVLAWRWWRRWCANRYRREALAELAGLRQQLADDARRAEALAGMAALLKRVALAAWPRTAVAGLSGTAWASFLVAHGAPRADVARLTALVDDAEYRAGLSSWPAQATSAGKGDKGDQGDKGDMAHAVAEACRQWIRDHRVRV